LKLDNCKQALTMKPGLRSVVQTQKLIRIITYI
jgi:hypothetical protein